MIHIGTSGWQYNDWSGLFYPQDLPKDRWLRYFSERFPTVEVNNSFYRLPTRAAFERWRRESTPGFIVTVKASRFITHLKRLRDPRESVEMFWERAVALGEKLGPVLFQLPPRFRADVDRLATFLDVLPKEMRVAMEFRDPSWDIPEVYDLLEQHGAALVLPDKPGGLVEPRVLSGWSYIRFHEGQPGVSDYTHDKLHAWADRIAAMQAKDIFVYFNNDPGGAAIRDAVTLGEMLEARRQPVYKLAG